MKVFYRISDAGYNKVKPSYISNEECLRNFCNVFFDYMHSVRFNNWDVHVIADNVSENTFDMIKRYVDSAKIERVSIETRSRYVQFSTKQCIDVGQ